MSPPIRLRRLYARDDCCGEFVIVAEPLPAHVERTMTDEQRLARRRAERKAIDNAWRRIRGTS